MKQSPETKYEAKNVLYNLLTQLLIVDFYAAGHARQIQLILYTTTRVFSSFTNPANTYAPTRRLDLFIAKTSIDTIWGNHDKIIRLLKEKHTSTNIHPKHIINFELILTMPLSVAASREIYEKIMRDITGYTISLKTLLSRLQSLLSSGEVK